jgi:hypothetical protein
MHSIRSVTLRIVRIVRSFRLGAGARRGGPPPVAIVGMRANRVRGPTPQFGALRWRRNAPESAPLPTIVSASLKFPKNAN